ncbi:MAG TPA: amino acid adenylation domain-containing protein [Blastocatellia bacterium]|nr:amino acid adenylation domain-containing protein [Blastocatellia bacterium]
MTVIAVEPEKPIGMPGHRAIEDSYALSPLQQGMLFHTLYAREPGVDIEQFLFTIHANLDIEAFARAWRQVVDRHPILRTSFRWDGLDEPHQEVHALAHLKLHHEDWRSVRSVDQQARLEDYLQNDRTRGFDLTRAPLMRIGLFHIGERDFHFVLTFHHLLLDGRSLVEVLRQTHAFYEALCDDASLCLEPPRPFREHIESLQQIDMSRAERFWRSTLSGFTSPTPLPEARNPGAISGDQTGHDEQAIRLTAALTSTLKTLALENGVTLYTLVEAAWALLLSRYSGEADVVFGGIRACRGSSDGAESVGLFINTLPIRVTVPEDQPLSSWLKELRAQHLNLREYENTPLPKIQEWSEVISRRPLFDSILMFENYDLQSLIQSHWTNWEIRDLQLFEETSYPLSLSGWSGETLLLKIEYDRQRFDQAMVRRMLGHLMTMLEGMSSYVHEPVSTLPMLTAAERHQIVVEWNSNNSINSPRTSVDRMFEEQAAKAPDAVAVICANAQLTYGELNRRANQLAHYLTSLGVGPEKLVGLLVGRSTEMIVGLLGILKAGGAYVPLDSAYPTERLAAMLADSSAPVLLTLEQLARELPATDARVICLDSDWEVIGRHSTENPPRRVTPENLAYLIYTSGSTGTPKGVLIEHRSLTNYIDFASDEFGITPGDRVLQFASSSFDTSAEEIYSSLARGATLVLRTDAMLKSISGFLRQCTDWGITVLDLPTAFWHELTTSLVAEGLSLPQTTRLVIIGGERALPERMAAWHERIPSGVRLLNTYGPTEATIVATIADLSKPKPSTAGVSDAPVGRPIPNARVYILDRHHQPAPVGVIGELHIGGAGLARGYLNHPDLTAEKFIPDPFSAEPFARLYKTGDLALYLPDGNIQIAGRIDDQVKVNGFRIELGEIETALCSSPDVHDAMVIAREDQPGEKRLVAYVVPRGSADSFAQSELRDQLRSFLKKKLPGYMVPSLFVALNELPISNSGKVDRTRLPAPDSTQIIPNDKYVRSRDPLERQLVEIWEEILKVTPVGIRDDFFELGGHSLLSVRMMGRIEQVTGRQLPLATLFEEATIEHLAATILEQETARTHSAIVKIGKGGSKRPFFFLHGDFNGGGFYCQNLAHGLGDDQPFYAIQPHGLDGGPIPSTIEAMAESHLPALREFQPRGPYLLGGYCNGAAVAFEIARLLQSQGEKIDMLVLLCASVRNALRFKLLHKVVNRLSDLDKLGSEQRLDRFLAYRERLTRVQEIKDYYRARLTEFLRLQTDERIAFIKKKSWTAAANLAVAFASIQRNGNSQGAPMGSDINASIPVDGRKRATAAYSRAIQGYVPAPYRGRVTVVWPSELALEDGDPTAGWSRVATTVDVQTVPGGHITCVTNHVRQLAETLKRCLEESRSELTDLP